MSAGAKCEEFSDYFHFFSFIFLRFGKFSFKQTELKHLNRNKQKREAVCLN